MSLRLFLKVVGIPASKVSELHALVKESEQNDFRFGLNESERVSVRISDDDPSSHEVPLEAGSRKIMKLEGDSKDESPLKLSPDTGDFSAKLMIVPEYHGSKHETPLDLGFVRRPDRSVEKGRIKASGRIILQLFSLLGILDEEETRFVSNDVAASGPEVTPPKDCALKKLPPQVTSDLPITERVVVGRLLREDPDAFLSIMTLGDLMSLEAQLPMILDRLIKAKRRENSRNICGND